MDLLAQPPLGADAHAVAHDQHPHHQCGIDRGPADGTVEWLQLRPHALEVKEAIDAPQQVISGDVIVEPELARPPAPTSRTESRQWRPINRRLNQRYPPEGAIGYGTA